MQTLLFLHQLEHYRQAGSMYYKILSQIDTQRNNTFRDVYGGRKKMQNICSIHNKVIESPKVP